jgi:hypothetical protein
MLVNMVILFGRYAMLNAARDGDILIPPHRQSIAPA